MFSGERTVQTIKVAGHQSTLFPHEQANINLELAGVIGYDSIANVLKRLGFKMGSKIKKGEYHILRADGTEINNAYLEGDHEKMRVFIRKAFSPSKWMIEQSRNSPAHLYELYHGDD